MFVEQNNALGQAQCESRGRRDSIFARQLRRRRAARFSAEGAQLSRRSGKRSAVGNACCSCPGSSTRKAPRSARARLAQESARRVRTAPGYRLGTAQADVSIAHVEHRLMNFHSAEIWRAGRACRRFETLRTPPRAGGLRSLVGHDRSRYRRSGHGRAAHRSRGAAVRTHERPLGASSKPSCFLAQIAPRGGTNQARLARCSKSPAGWSSKKPKPANTSCLLALGSKSPKATTKAALESVEAAAEVFGQRTPRGAITRRHLLSRPRALPMDGPRTGAHRRVAHRLE